MYQTDCEKIIELLRKAGKNGMHSFDLNNIVGTTRTAARINDIKKQGYKITSQYEKKGRSLGVRYFLNEKPKMQPRWVFEDGVARQAYNNSEQKSIQFLE